MVPLLLVEFAPIPLLRSFEDAVYDRRTRLRNAMEPQPISDRIRVIGVGDADEQRLDEDLHSRQAWIELLARLRDWRARSVTFDMFFVEEKSSDGLFASTIQSDDLPVVLAYNFRRQGLGLTPLRDAPTDFEEQIETLKTETDPAALAAQVRFLDDYLHQLREIERQVRSASDADFPAADRADLYNRLAWARDLRGQSLSRWFFHSQGREWSGKGHPFHAEEIRILAPLPMLAAQGFGFANVEKGTEDVVRRVPVVYEYDGRLFPQLSLATALQWYGVPFRDVEIDWGSELRFTPARNHSGTIRIPIDDRGQYLVNFREGESFLNRHPTIAAVLNPDLAPASLGGDPAAFFGDTFVFIGEVISGGEATDLEPIPLAASFPMVGLHANLLDNILRGDFLRVATPMPRAALALLLAALLAGLYWRLDFATASWLALAVLALHLVGQTLLFHRVGVVMNIVRPVLGMLFGVVLFFAYVIVVKDRDRRLVRDVFLKSVSPRIGEEILKNYGDDSIWAARREITILFIDIRGYTSMSEKAPPEAVLALLEHFYETASECVFRHDGQVNKFLGDAVLALFGALKEEPANHAERALRAAIDIQLAMGRPAESGFHPAQGIEVATGAAINTGEATVGLVGRLRIEYTALGDAVNIASRLQSLASVGEVIVGEKSMTMLGGPESELIRGLPLDVGPREYLPLKGKANPEPLYRATIRRSSSEI